MIGSQVKVNERAAPADFTDQPATWKRLGTFTVTSGTVLRVITWNGASDGQIDADAVQIQPV